MKTTLIYQSLLIGLLITYGLISCSGQEKDITKANTPKSASATYSLLPRYTSTSRPTVTLRPPKTVTRTLVPTTTNSPTPSLTPLATLGFAESQKMLRFMLYENGGCELPCWWGIVPGITKRDDMINMMMTFLKKVVPNESSYIDVGGGRDAVTTVIYYNPTDETDYKDIFRVVSVKGVVKRILIGEDLTGQFTLAVLLRKYGKPQQILLTTLAASPNGKVPFSLILSYPEQGILALFASEYGGKIQGNYVYICPQFTLPLLQLSASGNSQEGQFEMNNLMANAAYYGSYREYKSIETVSEFSIDKFYAVFQQKNTASCIVTEAEQWWSN